MSPKRENHICGTLSNRGRTVRRIASDAQNEALFSARQTFLTAFITTGVQNAKKEETPQRDGMTTGV